MRILIAEDDPISRSFLFKFLNKYGRCDMAVDGFEALDACLISMNESMGLIETNTEGGKL